MCGSASWLQPVWAIVTGAALPALPLLSTGFLTANVDLLWRDIARRGRAG